MAAFIALPAALAGCGSAGVSPADVATAAGAVSCDKSDYSIKSEISGKEEIIYDCIFGTHKRCVTYAGGVATDSTDIVRLLFQNKLGPGRPPCLG